MPLRAAVVVVVVAAGGLAEVVISLHFSLEQEEQQEQVGGLVGEPGGREPREPGPAGAERV